MVAGSFVLVLSPLHWPFLLLPLCLCLRMTLNAIDGLLACEFSQRSPLGAYLNELCDLVSDAALYLPFAVLAPFDFFWVAAFIFTAALTEYAGVLGLMVGASRRYDGPFGKSDRALVLGALGLWIGIGLPLPDWLEWLFPLLTAACAATVVNRVRAGLTEAARLGARS